MRYHLRTLLILSALAPPLLALSWTMGAKALTNYRARHQFIEWEEVGGPGSIEAYTGPMCNLVFEPDNDEELADDED